MGLTNPFDKSTLHPPYRLALRTVVPDSPPMSSFAHYRVVTTREFAEGAFILGWEALRTRIRMRRMNDYERIACIIGYLADSHTEQPDFNALVQRAGLSPFHFHRLFRAWESSAHTG